MRYGNLCELYKTANNFPFILDLAWVWCSQTNVFVGGRE